jgi:diguanylate cyclase (GGDEF)-like protein
MDGFKQVNDHFGHTAGNRVLIETAQALGHVCQDGDCAARMGGDEFVLLLPGASPDDIAVRMARLSDLVAAAGRRECDTSILRLSIGVSYYPDDGTDAEELLAKADARMYETKRKHHSEQNAAQDLTKLAQMVDGSQPIPEVLSLPRPLPRPGSLAGRR